MALLDLQALQADREPDGQGNPPWSFYSFFNC